MEYDNIKLEELEQEQYEMSLEQFALMVALLLNCKKDIYKEVQSFYSNFGTDGRINYRTSRKHYSDLDKRKRSVVLYSTIDDILDSYFLNIEDIFRNALIDIIDSEIEFFVTEVDIDDILKFKWGDDNANWNTRLWEHRDKWSKVIKKDLKLGFLRSEDIQELLDQLDVRFKSAEKALKKLFVTEYNAIESEARKRIFKELGVSKFQYYATLDERTCDECGSMHEQVFPMSAYEIGVTVPPIHSWCRCFIVPVD